MRSPPASAGITLHNDEGAPKDPTFCIGYTAASAEYQRRNAQDVFKKTKAEAACAIAPIKQGLGVERDSLPRSGGAGGRGAAPPRKD
jgi:hypothetical protein